MKTLNYLSKLLKVMKLTSIILLFFFSVLTNTNNRHDLPVHFTNESLEQVFIEINEQTDYLSIYAETGISTPETIYVIEANPAIKGAYHVISRHQAPAYTIIERVKIKTLKKEEHGTRGFVKGSNIYPIDIWERIINEEDELIEEPVLYRKRGAFIIINDRTIFLNKQISYSISDKFNFTNYLNNKYPAPNFYSNQATSLNRYIFIVILRKSEICQRRTEYLVKNQFTLPVNCYHHTINCSICFSEITATSNRYISLKYLFNIHPYSISQEIDRHHHLV